MVSAERVVAELVQMAYCDPAEIVAASITCPADLATLPPHVRRLVTGWKYDQNDNFTIELANRQRALEMLAKHLGLYHEDRSRSATEQDIQGTLLRTAFWRFVFSLHVYGGMSIAEAQMYAQRQPEELRDWAEAHGLLPKKAGDERGHGGRRTPRSAA